MREIELERQFYDDLIRRGAGLNPDTAILWADQLAEALAEGDTRMLPEDTASMTTMQGPGGGFAFMFGYSVWGGPDPFV
jgi:hypothetical protein